MQITIKITGNRETQAKLRRLGTSLHDMRSPMNEIGNFASKYYANQGFASQGGVFGNKWAPLSSRYRARKAKKYPGRPPLVATGRMQRSFYFNANSQSVLISNSDPKFKYHQSTAPRTKIPRRQMMGINDPIKQQVRQLIAAEVRRKIQNA